MAMMSVARMTHAALYSLALVTTEKKIKKYE
jgi:hypothetical protein